MKNLFAALATYGFVTRNHYMWSGTGSIANGATVAVKAIGNDLYEVTTHRFFDNGEYELDERQTTTAHAGQVWGLLPSWAFR